MSTWITSSGSIGEYTQSQSLSFTLSATTTLGGTLSYVLANNTTLPSGLSLNSSTGVISGTPEYVSMNTITYFSVSATETVDGVANENIQAFTIMVTSTVWETSAGSMGVFAENSSISYQFVVIPSQSSNSVVYSLLNGSLPIGSTNTVSLDSDGLLTGTPDAVTENTTYSFSIRAKEYNGTTLVGFKDRTFSITIDVAIPNPEFTTPSGILFTTYDSTWISFQLQYIDQNATSDIVISVVLGELPPGLEINSTGLIRGYATPPLDPTTITYSFTLEIVSDNGSSLTSYDIIVENQELQEDFIGRPPTILNTQPLTFDTSNTDIYGPYYLTGTSLGEYDQDSELIFKIIGYNFDGSDTDLYYVFNGPSIGVTYNEETGWISGILDSIGDTVETYNFTVSVYRISEPTLISDTFYLSLTVTGDIITSITWVTDSDLGTISNGSISDLSVYAASGSDVELEYRIIGSEIQSNLNTLISTGVEFTAFGDEGSFVVGSSDGLTWTSKNSINTDTSFLYFTSSVYDSVSEVTVLVGYNQSNESIIGQLIESENVYSYFTSSTFTTVPLRKVIYVNLYNIYVAVGDNGTIVTTSSPDNWTDIQTSGTTSDLNGVSYSNEVFGLYVAVGDNGVILTSYDAFTWSSVDSGTTLGLQSVIFVVDKFVIVGDLGIILISTDGITWTTPQEFDNDYNFKTIALAGNDLKIVVAGDNGIIIESYDLGYNWSDVANIITTSNISDIIYDAINTQSFYMAGEAGTILTYNNDTTSDDYKVLSSPTLTSFPPDLELLSSGEISGRLAFESTDSVQDLYDTRTYSLSIQAYYPDYPEVNSVKVFTLTTSQDYYLPYDTVYIKALPSLGDRIKLNLLLSDTEIIPDDYIYRIDDPYFGKATNVRYNHIYGVPSIARDDFFADYISAVQINHYWRNITLGEIKVAVARDSSNEVIYEVVYSAIQDNLVNSDGDSISKSIVWPRVIDLNLNGWIDSLTNIYTTNTYDNSSPIVRVYLSAIDTTTLVLNSVEGISVGMVMTAPVNFSVTNDLYGSPPIVISVDEETSSIEVSVEQTLTDNQQLLFNPGIYTSLTPGVARTLYPNSLPNMRQQIYDSLGRINDSSILPTWMTSLQTDGTIPGFTPAWVICYAKPGYGDIIKDNIETMWEYTLNEIDFELDRFEVDRSKTYNYDGTTISGQPIWNTLPSAQPNIIGDSADSFVYFPRKTILPNESQ